MKGLPIEGKQRLHNNCLCWHFKFPLEHPQSRTDPSSLRKMRFPNVSFPGKQGENQHLGVGIWDSEDTSQPNPKSLIQNPV